jgi:hypothetical protein
VITHGNGPQVGLFALESATDPVLTRPYPLDVLVAQTQGMIGYWFCKACRTPCLAARSPASSPRRWSRSRTWPSPTRPSSSAPAIQKRKPAASPPSEAELTGGIAAIGSLRDVDAILAGKAGTIVTPSGTYSDPEGRRPSGRQPRP